MAISETRLPGKWKKDMADAADGEDEFEAVDQRLSESQKFSLHKDLEGYRGLWDTSYVPSKNKHQNKLQKEKGLEELSQKHIAYHRVIWNERVE